MTTMPSQMYARAALNRYREVGEHGLTTKLFLTQWLPETVRASAPTFALVKKNPAVYLYGPGHAQVQQVVSNLAVFLTNPNVVREQKLKFFSEMSALYYNVSNDLYNAHDWFSIHAAAAAAGFPDMYMEVPKWGLEPAAYLTELMDPLMDEIVTNQVASGHHGFSRDQAVRLFQEWFARVIEITIVSNLLDLQAMRRPVFDDDGETNAQNEEEALNYKTSGRPHHEARLRATVAHLNAHTQLLSNWNLLRATTAPLPVVVAAPVLTAKDLTIADILAWGGGAENTGVTLNNAREFLDNHANVKAFLDAVYAGAKLDVAIMEPVLVEQLRGSVAQAVAGDRRWNKNTPLPDDAYTDVGFLLWWEDGGSSWDGHKQGIDQLIRMLEADRASLTFTRRFFSEKDLNSEVLADALVAYAVFDQTFVDELTRVKHSGLVVRLVGVSAEDYLARLNAALDGVEAGREIQFATRWLRSAVSENEYADAQKLSVEFLRLLYPQVFEGGYEGHRKRLAAKRHTV